MRPKPLPVIWMTGQSGTGKTTLSRKLAQKWDVVILDGDEMRECISIAAGFSARGRHEHNMNVARLAYKLAYQRMILVAVIAPFAETRRQISGILKPTWIHLHRDDLGATPDRPYETPGPDENILVSLDTGRLTVEESIETIRQHLIALWEPDSVPFEI